MFYITTIVKQPDGRYKIWDGAVVRIPAELVSGNNLKRTLNADRQGWSTTEFGYSCFATQGALGETYIILGANVPENSRTTKKFHGYDAVFSKKQIEQMMKGLAQFAEETRSGVEEEFGLLIHDMRALSTAIYNSAMEGKRYLDAGKWDQALIRFDNIIATQSILKYRADIIDLSGSIFPDLEKIDVPIFKKVDKVCRLLKPRAFDRKITITLEGQSLGVSIGPDIFEIVPYTIIDNAIKYAPDHTNISVEVSEAAESITMKVKSWGPRIEDGERQGIFLRGVRASAAAMSGVPGTGIGLYLVKKIMEEYFDGVVSVEQSENGMSIQGKHFYETSFLCISPRSRKS